MLYFNNHLRRKKNLSLESGLYSYSFTVKEPQRTVVKTLELGTILLNDFKVIHSNSLELVSTQQILFKKSIFTDS